VNKRTKTIAIVFLMLFLIVASGIIFVHFVGNETSAGKLYMFPLSVGEKIYIVTIKSNYSSAPEIYLPEIPTNMVEFDFRGPPENAFCNITIPKDLIWGELTVINKYYVMDESRYILTSNSTDNSIYFTFDHIALVKHFEVRGSEGAIT
jgi:hypothetical protein